MGSSRQIEDVAAVWLARRDGEHFSGADQVALSAWLDASTAHRIAFIRLEAAWDQTHRLRALGAGLPPGAVPSPGDSRHSPFFDRRLAHLEVGSPASTGVSVGAVDQRIAEARPANRDVGHSAVRSTPRFNQTVYRGIAIVAVICAVGSGSWYLWPRGPAYQTAIGGLEAIPLPDGSKATLNTNSGIRVAITETERRVDLQRGEAFFEVAKDPKRPFVVRAGDKRVIAVGTKFSVKRENVNVLVVVTEGRVRVESARRQDAEQTTFVSAGSVARAGASGVLVEDKALQDAEELLSWRRGFVVFRETPIADAAVEFNRYNTRKIVIEDPSLAAIRIGGNFRSNNAEAFVRLLADGLAIRVEERGDQIVLTRQ
jgi:transmembrane sensor